MSKSKRRVLRQTSLLLVGLLLVSGYLAVVNFRTTGGTGHNHAHSRVLPAAAVEPAPAALPRTGWTATASDEETASENGRAANVLDGNPATIWHSRYSPAPGAPLPHSITIDTKASQKITGLRYLPRADHLNGRVGTYAIHASSNGNTWSLLASGTWADSTDEKTVAFATATARYIRLSANSEAGDRGPWSSAAEINLLGEQAAPPTGPLPRDGWIATAGDEETASENGRAANVLDGSAATIWHSRYSPAPAAALPHTLTIDMGVVNDVLGLRYLPRADHMNGRIGAYTIHASSNGTSWTAIANGTWADNADEKTVPFTKTTARYIRLTASGEAGNRGPWSSAAEINLLGEQPTPPPATGPLPRTGWIATASDEETASENGRAANILDGNAATIWHSRYSPAPAAPLPHTLTIDMGAANQVSGLSYLPRADHANGRIGSYSINASSDGTTWSTIATGTWADSPGEKTAGFTPTTARYIRLTATSEAGNRGPWSSAAEINLLGEQPTPPPAGGPLSRAGWLATASDEETANENGRAGNVLDGNADTLWHSRYSPAPAAALPHTLTIDMGLVNQVSGLRYLPRANHVNGRIGQYSLHSSSNGSTWTLLARGTWVDNPAEKTVTFAAASARYIRLTASTEAGNRGPWSSAAEINLLGTPPTGPGSWSPTVGFPIVPAAAALLPGNRLLTWSAYSPLTFGGNSGITQTSVMDLSTGAVTQSAVANTGHDMFCPGTSLLPDGRIMVSGGSNSAKTSIYNPGTNTWAAGPDMNIGRGYQSNVTTSTGEVFTIGGSWEGGLGNKHGEVWSSTGGWRTLPNVPVGGILTADPAGEYRSDNHAWLFSAAGGRVFHAGPSRRMNWISTSGDGSITSAGLRSDSPDAMNGNAVMYDVGKILTMGGAPAYDNSDATARAYTIDINDSVTVARTSDMAVTRSFATGVVLPDGQVMVVGGQAHAVPFTDTGARMAPEIWDPSTGRWTAMAPMSVPRTYHSVALLLADGRVFVGGGGLCGTCTTNHLDGEIFTPPYLLNADGSARSRPGIIDAPATAAAGSTISVTTGTKITKFSLMRMSTVTHTVNTDQRRIPLTATRVSGTTASLTLPADRGVLVPGTYMLFAMDSSGVPSVASTIQIS